MRGFLYKLGVFFVKGGGYKTGFFCKTGGFLLKKMGVCIVEFFFVWISLWLVCASLWLVLYETDGLPPGYPRWPL